MKTIKELQSFNDIKTISLFSGAGGLDIGAIYAVAKIVWANDFKKEACASYAHNIGEHIQCGDINGFISGLKEYKGVDMVIGGPPCQGFSVAGKMDADDERSRLVWSYVQAIEQVMPKAFVMENVKALAELDKWREVRQKLIGKFRDLGYSVNFCVLNACDYDVPQSRERVFFVGFKSDSFAVPDLVNMMKPYAKKGIYVREALKVLDKAGTGNNKSTCNARITLATHPIMRKSPYAGMLFNGMGRPLRLDGYSSTLPASMGGNKTPIIDEQALYYGASPRIEDYHKRVEANEEIAKTESVPSYLRRMTVDEARVLQTFPLEYEFQGSQSAQYTQIGNAVPCNLAKAVCQMVIDVLRGRSSIVYSGLFS